MTPIERAKSDLTKLNAEISRLQFQLQNTECRRDKVAAYIEMAEVYEADDGTIEGSRVKGGVSGAAVRLSVEAIRERKTPIHTRDLLEILAKQGITIGGSNPVANLSGFLSRSEELRNSRADGWSLAEWGENGPRASATSASTPPVQPAPEREVPSVWGIENEKANADLDDEIPF